MQHSLISSVFCSLGTLMTNDRDLIKRIKSGDRDAFYPLIEGYKRLVYHIVYRMMANETDREDLCQDIFIKVYENHATFQHESRLSTWIAKIAYNTCINALRKKKVPLYEDHAADGESIETCLGASDLPDEVTEEQDLSARLQSEICKLPATFRTILTLFHVEEMSYAEIAAITNLPDGTVKNTLFRARRLLKERLLDKYHQEELWH